MAGFIKIQRSFYKHWLWESSPTVPATAFLDLLQIAAFAPTKTVVKEKLIHLQIGELVATERFLADRWKWSRTKVRSFLTNLEKDQMLNRRKDQGLTVLNLVNYSTYNGIPSKEKPKKKPEDEPNLNQGQTKGGPNIRSNKEGKEESKEEWRANELIFKGEDDNADYTHKPKDNYPTLDEVLKHARCNPVPILPECAEKWYYMKSSVAWMQNGSKIVDWRANLAGYANSWNSNNQQAQQRQTYAKPKPVRNDNTY